MITIDANGRAYVEGLVEGKRELGGVGNSAEDPLLVDPDGFDDIPGTEDDNLRLLPGSPAINAGDPAPDLSPSTDLDGHPRILCDRLDMGAYEFGIGDYDCDQAVDLFDFAAWKSCMTGPDTAKPYDAGCEAFDFNADDLIDLSDFAGFQSSLRNQRRPRPTETARPTSPRH